MKSPNKQKIAEAKLNLVIIVAGYYGEHRSFY